MEQLKRTAQGQLGGRAPQQQELAGRPRNRELNKFFKALSDETRRGILRLLEKRECSVGEIVGNFDLSQPTISRHLSVLKEADLVVDRRRGQHVIYRLNAESLSMSARRFFSKFQRCDPDFL